ncbi:MULTISPECIES: hypothetical protein [Paenibacillus]|uniref:hypothetical protein n=1 Tax=Paenibacillus TaxID=44249 RepID=UPI002040B52A|nr:hypothetical protein [Paenibacillus camelliae]MCM3634535.1 hypothetical protein [Paenibacillus camelliae]
MKKSFVCEAYEWEFARMFSSVSGSSKGYRNMPYVGCIVAPMIWLVLFGLYVLLTALLPEQKQQLAWLKDSAIGVGVLVGIIIFIRSAIISSKSVRIPQPTDDIPWVMTNEQGIWINTFNQEEAAQLPFFRWEDIQSVHVDITRELRLYIGGREYPSRREQMIAAYNAKYTAHQEQVLTCYNDRLTLILNKDRPLKRAIIQMPKSWLRQGQFVELLQNIQQQTKKTAAVYDASAEPYVRQWIANNRE